MNHLAFRRDTADEQLAVQFAVQVGSPELLQMLYVMTAADLGAVGPDVWDGWKTGGRHRPVPSHHAAPCRRKPRDDHRRTGWASAARRFGRLWARTRDQPWFAEHLEALPAAYLNATPPPQAAADLRCCLPRPRMPAACSVAGQYQPETATVQFTVATSERIAPGIFLPAYRRAEQPRPGNPHGTDSHPARRAGVRPLLRSRSRLCGRAAAAAAGPGPAVAGRKPCKTPRHSRRRFAARGRWAGIGRCACPACPRE